MFKFREIRAKTNFAKFLEVFIKSLNLNSDGKHPKGQERHSHYNSRKKIQISIKINENSN